jgi:hypothetical protein
MVIARRLLGFVEWALILFFSIVFLMLVIDLPGAWNAEPCWPHASQDCYPWGSEGPVAGGGWSYASKRNYLASGIFVALLTSVTLLVTFLVSRAKRVVVLMAGLALLYLGELLLPRVM